jgi:hypothetical protein
MTIVSEINCFLNQHFNQHLTFVQLSVKSWVFARFVVFLLIGLVLKRFETNTVCGVSIC